MDVRNCKQCGRLFNYLSGPPICPACKEQLEDKFAQTKEYVRNNPGATIQMVADDNQVSVQQIRQWVREERLEFSKDSPVGIECESCGATIRTGRYCEACKSRMCDGLTKAFAPARPAAAPVEKKRGKESDKMRFLH
jgi:flagellar operon protein (TIGR03826 family)